MSVILALRGRGNSGKTTTIEILHEIMIRNGYIQVPDRYRARVDFIDILSKKGKLIGITSSGDTFVRVSQRLEELTGENCNIIICACRTRGGSLDALVQYEDQEIRLIPKTIIRQRSRHETTNVADALRLLTMIEELI